MTPPSTIPCFDTVAPGTAAPVNGASVDEPDVVLEVGSTPVGPAPPTTVVASVETPPAGAGTTPVVGATTAGAVVTGISPTTAVVAPPTSVPVVVVNATCGTVYVVDAYVIVVKGTEPPAGATCVPVAVAAGGVSGIVVGTAVIMPGFPGM